MNRDCKKGMAQSPCHGMARKAKHKIKTSKHKNHLSPMIPVMIFHWKWRSITICNLAQSPIATYTFSQMYFTSKASLKKKYPSNREEAPVLLRKRGAPTLCTMSNHRKLWSPEGKNIARGGDLGHSLFTDLRKWKPFFPFGFSPLIIQTWLATWWITQGPSASERCKRRKFSSDTLVRRPRFQKGIWSKGPTEKKTVQHNLGSINHSCNWEMSSCIRH